MKIPINLIVFLENNAWKSSIEAKEWREGADKRELIKKCLIRVKKWRIDQKYFKTTGDYFVNSVLFELQDGNHRWAEFIDRCKKEDIYEGYVTDKDINIVKKSATEDAWIAIEECLEEYVYKNDLEYIFSKNKKGKNKW